MTPAQPRDAAVEAINKLDQRLAGEHRENVGRMDKIEQQIEQLRAGFVGNDPEGHRRYHELIIEKMEDDKRIRRAIKEHVLKSSTWAVLGGFVWFLVTKSKDILLALFK